jgi:DNA-binding MarR family transcriptional regulator
MDTLKIDQITSLFGQFMKGLRLSELAIWSELDLTMPQLKVLMVLFSRGQTSVSDLAEILETKPPNISWILDRLVEQKLVERDHDSVDRRVVYNWLTPKAKKLISQLIQMRVERFKKILTGLSPAELAQIEQSLITLNEAVRRENTKEKRQSDGSCHCCR